MHKFCHIKVLFADEKIKTTWQYLTARLIKEEFVSVQNFSNYDIRQMFNSVFENSQSPLYYRIMSAYQNKIEPKMILKNIIITAHELGFKTLCEGIETDEHKKTVAVLDIINPLI